MQDSRHHPFVVEVRFPAELEAVSQADGEDLPGALRQLWLVELVRRRRLGVARAARLAGLPLLDFYRVLSEHGVPALDLDAEELDADLRDLREAQRAS